jgi:hypothetical protein
MKTITFTESEITALIFEVRGAIEVINESLKGGDASFAGDDEILLAILQKLEEL